MAIKFAKNTPPYNSPKFQQLHALAPRSSLDCGMPRGKRGAAAAVRGAGEHIFNLVFECCTAEEQQKWLQIPLECALNRGDSRLVKILWKAGADMGNAVHETIEAAMTSS